MQIPKDGPVGVDPLIPGSCILDVGPGVNSINLDHLQLTHNVSKVA